MSRITNTLIRRIQGDGTCASGSRWGGDIGDGDGINPSAELAQRNPAVHRDLIIRGRRATCSVNRPAKIIRTILNQLWCAGD